MSSYRVESLQLVAIRLSSCLFRCLSGAPLAYFLVRGGVRGVWGQVEILLWIKFFPQPLMNASSPPEVKLPWLATLSLFSLWGLLFVAVSEDPAVEAAAAAARGGRSRARVCSSGGVASASESMNSMGSLLDGSSGSVGDDSVGGGGGGGGEGEKDGGGSIGNGSGNRADGAAAADGAGDGASRRRNG